MPFFTAIAAAFTAISSWTIGLGAFGTFAVGNFILRAAVSLGISALTAAFGGNKKNQADPFAIKGNLRTGGIVPRSMMLGRSLTGGSLVFHSEWGTAGGTPNAYYTQVIALSDVPVAGLAQVFIDGAAVTLGAADPDKGFALTEYTSGGTVYAWVKFYDGTQTAADPFLIGPVSAGPRVYSADRIGTGIAYAIVTYRINEEYFTGFPSAKFVLNGLPLYDISKDTTAGGSGAHRWDDPATWGGDGDDLPAVQAYNLARGIYFGGAWFYGLQGMSGARLPAANWIAQIGKCRAAITGADGPEPTYRCAGEIQVDAEIGQALEAVLTSCAGRISEIGGFFKIQVGAPDAPVIAFDDGDILSTAPQSFAPFFGLSNTVNGIIGTYPDPAAGYVSRSAPPIYNPDFEAEDGGRRLLTNVDLSFVPYPEQVQRLLAGEMAAARRSRRHTYTLPAKFYRVEPGDVVEWTSPRNGYLDKQFRVDGVIDLPNCDVVIDITEVDPADHGSFNTLTDYTPPLASPVLAIRPAAMAVKGFAPVAASVQDAAASARRPAILMQWDPDVDGVAGVRFQVVIAATGALVADVPHLAFLDGETLHSAGILPETVYNVRAIYLPSAPRAAVWSAWFEITTGAFYLEPADFAPVVQDALALIPSHTSRLDGVDGDLVILSEAQADLAGYNETFWGIKLDPTGSHPISFSGYNSADPETPNFVGFAVSGDFIVSGTLTAAAVNAGSFGVAGLAIFGDNLASDGYVPGVSGWHIGDDGSAEFNDLIVRGDMIAADAVTRRTMISRYASLQITATTAATAQQVGQIVTFRVAPYTGSPFYDNPGICRISAGIWSASTDPAHVVFLLQSRIIGGGGAWSTRVSKGFTARDGWEIYASGVVADGVDAFSIFSVVDYEYRIAAYRIPTAGYANAWIQSATFEIYQVNK